MKAFIPFLALTFLVGCSSSPYKEQTAQAEKIAQHMSLGTKYVGGSFDSKLEKSGKVGMFVVAVGKSIQPVDQDEELGEEAAKATAKFNLTQTAPSEFKTLVQKAIGTEVGVGEFNQIQTSITEVKALRGVDVLNEDIQCLTKITPTATGDYKYERECRALAKVPLHELNKAYNFTLQSKYKINKDDVYRKIAGEME